MKRVFGRLVGTAGAMALGVGAYAQSFNCDLDDPGAPPIGGGGTPSSSFGAAANSPGFWNSVYAAGGEPQFLRGLDGAMTSVKLTGPLGGSSLAVNYPGLTGDFRLLMSDATGVSPTKSFAFSGLANGFYRVYVYAVSIPVGTSTTTEVTVTPSITPNPQLVSGPMPMNVFTQGRTHSIHLAQVTNGSLVIRADMTGVHESYLNGFQVVAVPEPASFTALTLCGLGYFLRKRRA